MDLSVHIWLSILPGNELSRRFLGSMDLTPAFLEYLGNRAEKKVTPTSPVELNRI